MLNKLVRFFHFKERSYDKKVAERTLKNNEIMARFKDLSKLPSTSDKIAAIHDFMLYLEDTRNRVEKMIDSDFKKIPYELGTDLKIECYGIITSDNGYLDIRSLCELNKYLATKRYEYYKDIVICRITRSYTNPRSYFFNRNTGPSDYLDFYEYLKSIHDLLARLVKIPEFEVYISSYKDVFLICIYNLIIIEKIFDYIRDTDKKEAMKNDY